MPYLIRIRFRYFEKLTQIIFLTVFCLLFSCSQEISKNVKFRSGAINSVIIEKNGENLVVYGDPDDKAEKAEMILFTHFRRDVIWAGENLVQKGSLAVIPEKETGYFINGDSIWKDFIKTRYHNYYCQTTKIGIRPVKEYMAVKGGDILKWQGTDIRVFDTPGYTRGSVSYIIDIDNKRYAFVGDLIYDNGKILDLYSFQDSFSTIGGYHGYATRLGHLISSLNLITAQKPDFLIPARGPVIKDPDSSIQKLIQQVRLLYNNYLSISAYNWYYPGSLNTLSDHVLGPSVQVERMPLASVISKDPPSWYMHFSNSNLVFAEDSSAFLIDCGTRNAFEKVKELKKSGRLKSLDGLFITHYHDDHTNFVNDIVKEFTCPVYITEELKDILENPAAYNMPCLTTDPIPDLTIMQEGSKISWKDFNLTFSYFPGQTLYHDAVLFEKENGEAVFFLGDSFTPSGIDDYCLLNRNLLHPGTGYFYCLDFLKKLPENVLLSNQHVEPLFKFSNQQLDYMVNTLLERNILLKELLPYDNINYGVDEQWCRVYPYEQKTDPGQTIDFSVKVVNHSDVTRTFIMEPNIPEGMEIEPKSALLEIEPLTEGERTFKLNIHEQTAAGAALLTINIKSDELDLHEWCESLIEIYTE